CPVRPRSTRRHRSPAPRVRVFIDEATSRAKSAFVRRAQASNRKPGRAPLRARPSGPPLGGLLKLLLDARGGPPDPCTSGGPSGSAWMATSRARRSSSSNPNDAHRRSNDPIEIKRGASSTITIPPSPGSHILSYDVVGWPHH